MFDVLVYVYENFWSVDSCPQLDQLGRKLSAAGFEPDEIEQALQWLAGLNLVSHQSEPIDISATAPTPVSHAPSELSLRVYSVCGRSTRESSLPHGTSLRCGGRR